MPRTEEENQKIRELQRIKILKAAKETFLRKGQSATMADIASEAGVSQGLAYRYFESKTALCTEVMREMSSGDIFGLSELRASGKSPSEKLGSIMNELLHCVEKFEITVQAAMEVDSPKNIDYFHSMYHQLKAGTEEERGIAANLEKQFLSLRSYIRELILQGQTAGEFIKEDPDKLTIMIFTSLKGLTALAIRHPEQFTQHAPYTDLILRILKV